jgi:hypothetical protein
LISRGYLCAIAASTFAFAALLVAETPVAAEPRTGASLDTTPVEFSIAGTIYRAPRNYLITMSDWTGGPQEFVCGVSEDHHTRDGVCYPIGDRPTAGAELNFVFSLSALGEIEEIDAISSASDRRLRAETRPGAMKKGAATPVADQGAPGGNGRGLSLGGTSDG